MSPFLLEKKKISQQLWRTDLFHSNHLFAQETNYFLSRFVGSRSAHFPYWMLVLHHMSQFVANPNVPLNSDCWGQFPMVISGLQKNIEGSIHPIHQRTSRLLPKKTSEICTRPASFLSISPRGYQGCCSSKCPLLNRPLLLCHALEAVELQGSWNLLRGSLQWICFWLQNDSWWIVWKRSK